MRFLYINNRNFFKAVRYVWNYGLEHMKPSKLNKHVIKECLL